MVKVILTIIKIILLLIPIIFMAGLMIGFLSTVPPQGMGFVMDNPNDEEKEIMKENVRKYTVLTADIEREAEDQINAAIKKKWGSSARTLEDSIYYPVHVVDAEVEKIIEKKGGDYDKDGNPQKNGGYDIRTEREEVGRVDITVDIPDWTYLMSAGSALAHLDDTKIDYDGLEESIEKGTEITMRETKKNISVSVKYPLSIKEFVLQQPGGTEEIAKYAENYYKTLSERKSQYSFIEMDGELALVPPGLDLPYDGSIGSLIVQYAAEQLGLPYSQGGDRTTTARDCSSMVMIACNKAGIPIVDVAAYQGQWCVENNKVISFDSLQPGDLVFWALNGNNNRPMNISHVAVYAGNGMLIEASTGEGKVVYRGIWGQNKIVLCARPYA